MFCGFLFRFGFLGGFFGAALIDWVDVILATLKNDDAVDGDGNEGHDGGGGAGAKESNQLLRAEDVKP